MLRSHRLERLISGSERPRVPTENRGFVMKKTFTGKSSLSILLCFAGLLSFAAPKARADEEKDPPTRVARISYVDGSVSLQPGGQGDWGSAAKNRPVTIGDKIWVDKDYRAEFNGTENIQYSIEKAPGPDGLDRWAAERDLKEDHSVSAKYVSRDMVGYDDLDDYGDWRDEPEYGHVWYPREVAIGWAPYSYGYWNWVGPWGWTWVDYSPWGFAPYHYGRWNYFGGRWGWCPGPAFGYPVYGPAFVGFFGGGFGFGVGWFPLGFGEPFFPWFRCRHDFVERINVRNTFIRNRNVFNTNIRNVNFVNAHNVNAVTVANRNAFMNGQAINRGATHLTPAALRGAQVTNSVGIHATPHSALGSVNMRSNVARPPASVQNRAVIARTAPAAGTSQMRVHTVNSAGLTPGRSGNAPVNSGMSQRLATQQNMPTRNNAPATYNRPGNSPAMNGRFNSTPATSQMTRQRELSQNRPPSAMSNSNRTSASVMGNTASQRAGNSPRTWEAQGNATDRGRAPAGFGNSNRSTTTVPAQTARMSDTNRPPWARGGGQPAPSNGQSSRPSASTPSSNSNRPSNSNSGRAYEPPQRSQPFNNNRGYSQQPRSYSPPPSRSYSEPRTYSAPSRSYPAPSRSYSTPSYSAPSRSYSGGGGGSRSYSGGGGAGRSYSRSEEHTSELQSPYDLVCRLLLEKKKKKKIYHSHRCTTKSNNNEI